MYSGQTISLKTILWKILRNPLAAELTYEDAAELAIEAIRLLGAPLTLVDKVTDPLIHVQNYKAALPSNLLEIRGVRIITDKNNHSHNAILLRYATDIYHNKIDCDVSEDNSSYTEFTYTTQKGVIFTSTDDCDIQISYRGLAVDDEGYPLIPDDQDTIMAMEYYILQRYLEPLWMMGKITDKAFQYVEQKRYWYMGAASTSLKLAGPDQLESAMNTINRLIVNTQAYNNFYKGSGLKERLKKY